MIVEEIVNGVTYQRHTNPIKAIRQKCVEDCCAGYVSEANNCLCPSCPLFPFRMGKNPYRTSKVLSEEEKKALRERLQSSKPAKN